ncbi:MAG: hypothetical protein ACKO6N_07535 [Myxococcota bacterium]
MAAHPQESLGTILLRFGMVEPNVLEVTLQKQRETGERLGELLLKDQLITEEMLVWCLANQLNLPCVASLETRRELIGPEAVAQVPASLAWRHHLMPMLLSDGELSVATDDPLDRVGLEDLSRRTGLVINVAIAPPSLIRESLEKLYGPELECLRPTPTPVSPAQQEVLTSFLLDQAREGVLRIRLDTREGQEQIRLFRRESWEKYEGPLRAPALLAALQLRVGEPRSDFAHAPMTQLFHLELSGIRAVVALEPHSNGGVAVIQLENPIRFPMIPERVRQVLRHELKPGLWCVLVSEGWAWRSFAEGMRLDREARGQRVEVVRGREHDTVQVLEPILRARFALCPELLAVSGRGLEAVAALLKEESVEQTLLLQLALPDPRRGLALLHSAGLYPVLMAQHLRGFIRVEWQSSMGHQVPILTGWEVTPSAQSCLEQGDLKGALQALKQGLFPTSGEQRTIIQAQFGKPSPHGGSLSVH